MRLGAVVQARMSSRRLPGKVLHRVAGKPLLEYVLERLAACRPPLEVVVATSRDPDDDAVAAFCRERGVACFRGPLDNVAERFRLAAEAHELDAFVRVNGDSPLLDPRLVDRAVALFLEGGADLVTNVAVRTFPTGQSVEVVSADAFRRATDLMREPEDFEHVTKVFYKNRDRFRVRDFRAGADYGGVYFAIDTPEQMGHFASLLGLMDRPHEEYDVDTLVRLYRRVVNG